MAMLVFRTFTGIYDNYMLVFTVYTGIYAACCSWNLRCIMTCAVYSYAVLMQHVYHEMYNVNFLWCKNFWVTGNFCDSFKRER